MITEQNLFQKGMLIHLSMGAYSGKKKLSKDQMGDLPTEIVRGVHDLFDKEFKKLLKEISAFDRDTRHIVKYQSIPFKIDGVYFIASDKIESIIETIDRRKLEREELIQNAVENYEEAISRFAEEYPAYYEHGKHKYLSKEGFQNRFYCKYQFLKISAPDEDNSIISPELYRQEMAKFRETIDEMKNEVVATIYEELAEVTVRLRKQATDGKPNQRTINTMNEFLQKIEDVYSDFVDRDDIKDVIKKVRGQMLGITAEELRDVDSSREAFRKGISEIVGEIKNLPDIPLKRNIQF